MSEVTKKQLKLIGSNESQCKDLPKEAKPKRNFDLPAFINSDGVVITQAIGVKVPPPDSDKPEAKRAIIEIALRNFKRKVKDSGVIEEYKRRTEYIKPSMRNRQKRMDAIRQAKYLS